MLLTTPLSKKNKYKKRLHCRHFHQETPISLFNSFLSLSHKNIPPWVVFNNSHKNGRTNLALTNQSLSTSGKLPRCALHLFFLLSSFFFLMCCHYFCRSSAHGRVAESCRACEHAFICHAFNWPAVVCSIPGLFAVVVCLRFPSLDLSGSLAASQLYLPDGWQQSAVCTPGSGAFLCV